MTPQCLKITEKVSFNITSEASFIYILNEQKLVKNAKNEKFKCDILADFQTLCDPIFYPLSALSKVKWLLARSKLKLVFIVM